MHNGCQSFHTVSSTSALIRHSAVRGPHHKRLISCKLTAFSAEIPAKYTAIIKRPFGGRINVKSTSITSVLLQDFFSAPCQGCCAVVDNAALWEGMWHVGCARSHRLSPRSLSLTQFRMCALILRVGLGPLRVAAGWWRRQMGPALPDLAVSGELGIPGWDDNAPLCTQTSLWQKWWGWRGEVYEAAALLLVCVNLDACYG